MYQGQWSLSIKNAPAYFLPLIPKSMSWVDFCHVSGKLSRTHQMQEFSITHKLNMTLSKLDGKIPQRRRFPSAISGLICLHKSVVWPNVYGNNDQFEISVILWSVGTLNQFSFFQKAKFKRAFVCS